MAEKFNRDDHELLIKLDARLENIEKTVVENRVAMAEHISDLKKEIANTTSDAKDTFVTKSEFSPVQKAVYAAIGFILTGFLGAVLSLVLKSAPILPH